MPIFLHFYIAVLDSTFAAYEILIEKKNHENLFVSMTAGVFFITISREMKPLGQMHKPTY